MNSGCCDLGRNRPSRENDDVQTVSLADTENSTEQGKSGLQQATDAIPTAARNSTSSRSSAIHLLAERRLPLATVKGQNVSSVTAARWADDGSRVLISTNLGVQVIDASSWRVTRVFTPDNASAADAQFSGLDQTTGSETVATFDGTTVSLWNLQAGHLVSQFRGPFPVSAVAMSAGEAGDQMFVAGASIRVFDGRAQSEQFGRPLFHQQNGHKGNVTSIVTGPQDRLLLVCDFL